MNSVRAQDHPRRETARRRFDPVDQQGFSILEVIIAIFLLLVGILGALLMVNTANSTSFTNNARTSGVNLAREVADGSRVVQGSLTYAALSSGCTAPSSPANPCSSTSPLVTGLQAQPGLAPDSSSPPGVWTVIRAGITYTLKVSICSMDDPTDGYGDHTQGGPYCADVAPSGVADSDGDDYKRVIVDVTWPGTRDSGNARAITIISSSGINGPTVSCLRPTGSSCPSAPQITSGTSVNFTATVKGTATRLDWYVNGTYAGTATPSAGSATFTWNLGTIGAVGSVFDGSYEISAAVFDSNGKSGTIGSVQVQVNRRAPGMPGNYTAGRDTEIDGNGTIGGVDLNWLPVPDRDVLYFRIYKKVGTGAATLLAQTADSSVTSYTDLTPPANPTDWSLKSSGADKTCASPQQVAASQLYYYVVAVDQNGAAPREGTPTASIDVNLCNHAPKKMGSISLVNNSDGTVSLTGSLPGSPTDVDSADDIYAFRIYRWTGTSLPVNPADRYDFVLLAGLTGFVDPSPRPGGVLQKYCVTTVDTRMQESPCSNVVTG